MQNLIRQSRPKEKKNRDMSFLRDSRIVTMELLDRVPSGRSATMIHDLFTADCISLYCQQLDRYRFSRGNKIQRFVYPKRNMTRYNSLKWFYYLRLYTQSSYGNYHILSVFCLPSLILIIHTFTTKILISLCVTNSIHRSINLLSSMIIKNLFSSIK